LAFVARQTTQFEKVFLILENHEFYGLSFQAGLETARRLENEAVSNGRLILMHRRHFDISNSDIIVLRCTLWSAVPEDAREVVRMKVKDSEKIEGCTVDDHNASHEADLTWLRDHALDIQQNKSTAKGNSVRNIIVITHYAPSIQETSSPKNISDPWSSAFATDLLGDAYWGNVKVWVFGHTHFTTQFERSGIKVLSNQRGYVLPGSSQGNVERDKRNAFDIKRVVRI